MRNKRRLPSCRKASSGKALSGQPILANSVTYHWFRVSFQVALDTTTTAGQSEITQPAHCIQRFCVDSRKGTAAELINDLPLWNCSWPLNQLNAVAGGIHGDAYYD